MKIFLNGILSLFCLTQILIQGPAAQAQAQAQELKPATLVLQIKNLRPGGDSLQNASVYSDGKIVIESAIGYSSDRPFLVTRTFHVEPSSWDGSLFYNIGTVRANSRSAQKMSPGVDPCFAMSGNFEATVASDSDPAKMVVVESADCQGQSIHLPEQVKPYMMNIWYSLNLLGTAKEQ